MTTATINRHRLPNAVSGGDAKFGTALAYSPTRQYAKAPPLTRRGHHVITMKRGGRVAANPALVQESSGNQGNTELLGPLLKEPQIGFT